VHAPVHDVTVMSPVCTDGYSPNFHHGASLDSGIKSQRSKS